MDFIRVTSPPMPEDPLYRYHDYKFGEKVTVEEHIFKIVRKTPSGFWIQDIEGYDKERWVADVDKGSRKRYAYRDKKRAIDSFEARKRKQVSILASKLSKAKEALKMAREMQENYVEEG